MRSHRATICSTTCSAQGSTGDGGRVRSKRSHYPTEPVCSTSAPARRIWRSRRSRRSRGTSVVGVDFAGAMLRLGLAKIRTRRSNASIRLVRGDAARNPGRDRSCDAATIAFGIRNVAEPERALRRNRARPAARAAGSPSSSSGNRASPAFARFIRGISATCCRSSAGSSRNTRAPIPTCPPRSGHFRPLPSSRGPRCHRFFTRSGRPSHLRHRLSVRCAKDGSIRSFTLQGSRVLSRFGSKVRKFGLRGVTQKARVDHQSGNPAEP